MSLDESTSRLVGQIYDAANDSERWNEVLAEIIRRTDSALALLSIIDLKTAEFSGTHWYGKDDSRFLDGVREYETHLFQSDPTLRFGRANPLSGFISLSQAVTLEGGEMSTHPYSKWNRGKLGVGETIVRYTAPIDGLTIAISLHTPSDKLGFEPEKLNLFSMLFEHVERSIRLAVRPPDFVGYGHAVIAVDSRCQVISLSKQAERIVAEADGIEIKNNQLTGSNSQSTDLLRHTTKSAIEALAKGTSGGILIIQRPSGKKPYFLDISPIILQRDSYLPLGAAALIYIKDLDGYETSKAADTWIACFGVTRSEARLMHELVNGDGSLRDAAIRLGIAYSTARVHLASIFRKTGTNSQAKLVLMLSQFNTL